MGSSITSLSIASVTLASFSTILAMVLLYKRRYLIIKPTYFLSLLLLLQSWSTVANIRLIYHLPNPWHYIIVIPLTNVILLLISIASFDKTAKQIWDLAINVPPIRYLELKRLLPIGFVLAAICFLIYFLYVPPWQTGLWVALKYGDYTMSVEAREESLKLIPAIPRYAFSFYRSTISEVMAAAIALIMVAQWNFLRKRVFIVLPFGLLFFAILASIYGARGPAGMVIAAFILAWFLYKKMSFNPIYVSVCIGLILLFPTAMSAVRHGGFSLDGLLDEFDKVIFRRVFDISTEVGVHHMNYVQRNGYWGIAAIHKLALLFGVQPVNVDNIIINTYMHSKTGLATVNSFITNYSNFGLYIGMILSIFLTWLLDLVILLYRRFTPTMLLVSICTILISVRGVIASNFETMIITGGFIPSIILLIFFNRIIRNYEYQKGISYEEVDEIDNTFSPNF